ncbi:hypothetical protein [Microbacterium tumbae]
MAEELGHSVWSERFVYLIQESFEFLEKAAKHHRDRVVVRAVPRRDGEHRIVYRYGVRGELKPNGLTEEFRDILGRARSLLDIAMYTAASEAASPPLTRSEERGTYFPIASTAEEWSKVEQKRHLAVLTSQQRSALKAMQPFSTGAGVITWFQQIHNTDKHRRPLVLETIPDPEFVMVFGEVEPLLGETREHRLDWVDPLPAVAQRVDFVEIWSVDPIRHAGVEDVPIALAVWVDEDWRDVQHLLWDVIEFTSRACAILYDGDTGLADAFKAIFGRERAQLAAFNRMMVTGDPEAEREWASYSSGPFLTDARPDVLRGHRG